MSIFYIGTFVKIILITISCLYYSHTKVNCVIHVGLIYTSGGVKKESIRHFAIFLIITFSVFGRVMDLKQYNTVNRAVMNRVITGSRTNQWSFMLEQWNSSNFSNKMVRQVSCLNDVIVVVIGAAK